MQYMYICTQILTRLNFCLCLGVDLSPNDNETTKIEALVLGDMESVRVCVFHSNAFCTN